MNKYFTYFLVATNQGFWGGGDTLEEALKNASALNIKTSKIRKNIRVSAWLNIQSTEDCLDEQAIKEMESNPYCRVTGYKVGDHMFPFINSYGGPCYHGSLQEIDIPH